MRLARGLTLRDVQQASKELAIKRRNRAFLLPPSRLSDIEAKGTMPNAYRLFALSVVYDVALSHLLELYGIG
jgi:transcriptional regulator with XRE-family HTH domain